MITATDILPAMRDAIRAHPTLALSLSAVPTIVIGHSGTFAFDTLPRPAIVLAPLREDNPRLPVTRNGEKIIPVIVYAYTDFFGQEIGMLGDDYTLGVMPLIDTLELILDQNLLGGTVIRANATGKEYPLPADMNYVAQDIGLNEARLAIEYFTIDSSLL